MIFVIKHYHHSRLKLNMKFDCEIDAVEFSSMQPEEQKRFVDTMMNGSSKIKSFTNSVILAIEQNRELTQFKRELYEFSNVERVIVWSVLMQHSGDHEYIKNVHSLMVNEILECFPRERIFKSEKCA